MQCESATCRNSGWCRRGRLQKTQYQVASFEPNKLHEQRSKSKYVGSKNTETRLRLFVTVPGVGTSVGDAVGLAVGVDVGLAVGDGVGVVGVAVGVVGAVVGVWVGEADGTGVGGPGLELAEVGDR